MEASEDIAAALHGHPGAWERFERLPPSHKAEYLTWIAEAKRPETRSRRIAQMVQRLAKGG